MSSAKAIQLEHARHLLKQIEGDESAFRTRVARLPADHQAAALEWFYRVRDKQRARIQQFGSELAKVPLT
jgi:hypothetical protein